MYFIKKIMGEKELLITGTTEQGIDCYYRLIPTNPETLDDLRNVPKGGLINITDYGEVLERGYGDPEE